MAMRAVIVGGDAGGMAAVSPLRALQPDAEVIAFERTRWTSYSACGIPFHVSGKVAGGVDRLVARSPEQHRANGIDLRVGHEVVELDLDRGEVVVAPAGGDHYRLGFDRLLLGVGARPIRPPLPGIDLPFVHGVQTLDDAIRLRAIAEQPGCPQIVIVGGGYIGLEMAEAYIETGCRATIVERAPQVLGLLDAELAELVTDALRARRIEVRTGVEVLGFDDGVVRTDGGDLPADLVVLGLGVRANSDLARDAGIELGVAGAIRVDDRQRTSHDAVWAAGDCTASRHLVSGRPVYMPLGTYANKQARVAGNTMGGGQARFAGVLGTAISKLCETELATTGLRLTDALDAGFDAVAETVRSVTRAGYFPGAAPITVKLVGEKGTGRLLGGQIVGGTGAGKRIDTIATAVTAGLTAEQVADLDLAYAPPFSPVWDPVAIAARQLARHL